MKSLACAGLLAILAAGTPLESLRAQSSVTRRTVQTPGPRGNFLPPNSAGNTTANVPIKSPAPVTPSMIVDHKVVQQPSMVIVAPQAPPSREEIAKREQSKLNFQLKQAEAGRSYAQYEVGMRYLKGDGLPQSQEEARKWIARSAAQEYSLAIKKLAELDKALPADKKKPGQ